MKKYELVMDDTIRVCGRILYRIRALINFSNVKAGDLGGYIQKEENLSHNGNCWVYHKAKVFDNATVEDDAVVYHNAFVFDKAKVFGNANVYGRAKISGKAKVFGNAVVNRKAIVFGNATVYDNAMVTAQASIGHHACAYDNAIVKGTAKVRCSGKINEYQVRKSNVTSVQYPIY